MNTKDLCSISYPFKIVYYQNVDVNGFDFARQVVKYITNKYTNAVYFCCGQGAVGFNLLNNNQVENIKFIYCYEHALEGCRHTAKINGWEQRCRFSINLYSVKNKVDLFVADPPWWPNIMPGPKL